jgi:sterol desaturase/sphingolipid hydroxylase (fatty acid hydroxylase superfamily)
VVFDLIFFIGHRAFHAFPWLYKHVHAAHHSSPIIRATDSIRHTFWDGTWDVICSVLALNLTRAHPLSRALYNIVAISLIAEAHGGLDLPWAPHNIFPYVLAGPITHDAHHRLGRVNYQKYFMYLDWACGTLRVVPRFPGTPYESHESQESQAGSQGTKGTKQL